MSLFDHTRRRVFPLAAAAFAAFALAIGTLPALAAIDSYISFGGASMQGAGPSDQIEIESFSWGQASIGSTTGGAGAGKVRMSDLQITKKVDNASPKLFQACASGQHFTTLTLARAGTTTVFDDVMIVSVRTSGGNPPLETLTLSYAKVELSGRPPMTTIDTHTMLMPAGVGPTKKP
jgi:type VI secretion system secreted protein Hcp